jgi:16S rRNA (uracil1498-N3)-methyltransferase
LSLPVFKVASLPALGGFRLDGPEGRHAATVRRIRPGEQLLLVDGVGGSAAAEAVSVGRDVLDVEISGVRHDPSPSPRLTVVQALAKGDRGELAVELLTEVGVDVIVPWAAARCVVRWDGDRGAKARARWQATADAAAKQSRRTWWPAVADLASTGEVASLVAGADLAVVLHEDATDPLPSAVAGEVVVVVGPEGGINPDEIAVLGHAHRLGSEVLRTSTAGVAAAAALLSRTSRWS